MASPLQYTKNNTVHPEQVPYTHQKEKNNGKETG